MISVVIPAYNEEKYIAACLDSLVKQKTEKKFEVILADNNSSDKTVATCNKYKNKLDLKIIIEKKKGRAPARRAGFAAASGEIILSTDSDSTVPPNWIDHLTNTLTKSMAVAVSGTGQMLDQSDFKNKFINFIQPISMHVYKLLHGYYWLTGFNFAIYKNVYEKAGGFNNKLNAFEDVELAMRVRKIGKIKFLGALPVTFSGRRWKNGILKGGMPYFTSFYAYYFKFKSDAFLSDVR